MNDTYGSTPQQLIQNIQNATVIGRNNPSEVVAFDNQQFQSILTDSGKKSLILAGFPADFGLLYNALAAQQQGYNVWAVLDSSPAYDGIDSASSLAKLATS